MVSSQKMNIRSRSSAVTRPNMAPAKASSWAPKPPRSLVLVLEVPGAVDQHQRAHAQDQQGHHPGQRIHPEGQLQLQLRGSTG